MSTRVPALVLTAALSGAALAQPSQVQDINTTRTEGTFQWPWTTDFVEMGGVAWFTVSDCIHAAASTSMVKDINPGGASTPWELTIAGSWVYFRAMTAPTAPSCGGPTARRPTPPWSRTSGPASRAASISTASSAPSAPT